MLKTWQKIDSEAVSKLSAEVLNKISGGVSADDVDDPWQWCWLTSYSCPICGEDLIAYAPNDEIQYLFCWCGFKDRYRG